jgi:hypothetical protein
MKNKKLLQNSIKGHYTKIPNKLFELGLPPQLASVYVYLISLPEDFNPSITNICNKVRISRPTAMKHLRWLEGCNMIKRISKGNNLSHKISMYELRPINEWSVPT